MRLLSITAKGIKLFKNEIKIDFFAENRVLSDNSDMCFNVFDNMYTNNVISVAGINAAGKTSVLKLISFVIDMLNGVSVNNVSTKEILGDSQTIDIETIFYDDVENVCKLSTKIELDDPNSYEKNFIIVKEEIVGNKVTKIRSKSSLTDFTYAVLIKERNDDEEYLQNDVSIAILYTKKNSICHRNLIEITDNNYLKYWADIPHELIAFLDSSIEKIEYDYNKKTIILKFYGKAPIKIVNLESLRNYLSSGTIKGINVFVNAILTFKKGGYLIIDELENHFNAEIVATLVRFYMNRKINKYGGTLIFSTHYSEILDELDRTDNIYVVRNISGITLQKLSYGLKRNDIKKSEIFKSDYLKGTVPSYESYMDLKKKIMESL